MASSCGARKEWVCETGGAGGWFGQGEAKWPGQVAAPTYGAAVGTVQEGAEVGDEGRAIS